MDGMRRVCGTIVLVAALLSLAACGGGGGAGAGAGVTLTGTWAGDWTKTIFAADDSGLIDSAVFTSDNPPSGTMTFIGVDAICDPDTTAAITGTLSGTNLSLTLTGTTATSVVTLTATLDDPMNGTYEVTDGGATACVIGWGGTFTLIKS